MARARGGIAARQGGKRTTVQRLTGSSRFDRCRMGTLTRVDSAVWDRTCAAVRVRDGHRCTRCGTTENLTVDHIIPHSQGGQSTFSNLTTLCRGCHKMKIGKANKLGARLL